jgi:hypothetical protein
VFPEIEVTNAVVATDSEAVGAVDSEVVINGIIAREVAAKKIVQDAFAFAEVTEEVTKEVVKRSLKRPLPKKSPL